jgi:hypothetical protein
VPLAPPLFRRLASAFAGVEAASEALSTEDAGGNWSPEVDDGGDEASWIWSLSSDGVLSLGKRLKSLGDTLSTTVRVERPLAVGEEVRVEAGILSGKLVTRLLQS